MALIVIDLTRLLVRKVDLSAKSHHTCSCLQSQIQTLTTSRQQGKAMKIF